MPIGDGQVDGKPPSRGSPRAETASDNGGYQVSLLDAAASRPGWDKLVGADYRTCRDSVYPHPLG